MDATDTETTLPRRPSYHWTPALQREFLEQLAATGSVQIAAMHVSMSPSAAYQLRHRPDGAAFRLGWAAAVLIARDRLTDELLHRAIWGHEETATISRDEDGRSFARRQRRDSRLGLAMLARLDQMVEVRARGKEAVAAQLIAGDWPGFLALFDAAQAQADAARAAAASTGASSTGDSADALPDPDAPSDPTADTAPSAAIPGQGAALAVWLSARDHRSNPLASLWAGSAIACEVARISAGFDADLDSDRDADLNSDRDAEPTVEETVGAMGVWRDRRTGEWRTDFPPPAGFTGIEEGEFGEARYERSLDPDEEDAWEAARAADAAPLRHAAEAARRACFGLPAPANDPDGDDTDTAPRAAAGG